MQTRSADEFICEQRRNAALRRFGAVVRPGTPLTQEDAAALAFRAAKIIGTNRVERSHIEAARSIEHALEQMATDLHDDIERGLPQEAEETHRRTKIALLPTGWVNASARDRDLDGNLLDHAVILINHGLQFSSYRLSEAVIRENLAGDLSQYRTDGTSAFKAATDSYLKRSLELATGPGTPLLAPASRDSVDFYSGAFAMHILCFVALHEFGHIQLQHLGIPHLGADQEMQADEFAIECSIRAASSDEAAWRNLAPAYLYLLWLDHVELVSNRPTCPDHPPPLDRARHLREFLTNNTGDSQPQHFDWIDSRIPVWTNTRALQ